ncbi:MAG: thiamine pyrophosphate-binding protein, partial [Pseudomonadota bacterium]
MNDQPHADDPGLSCGVAMTRLLERAGVRHVFGIPGNHTLELYRGLDQSSIQHITTRHEQGAAFMADGYARATGQPGVCYLISGPGLLNAATPLGQALADSVPVLVITAVAALPDLGKRFGKLHELPDQQAAARSFCRESLQIRHATDLIPALERAWLIFEQERPGPVHIEIPLDVMESAANAALLDEFSDRFTSRSTRYGRHQSATAHQATIDSMAKRLQAAQQPALLLGGGSQRCDPTLLQRLAETLDAPVANTVNAKGLISPTHPLALGSSPSAPTVADVLRTSDCVLALGTEFSETDYDLLMAEPFGFTGDLLRIDIDPGQLNRNHTPLLSLCTAVEAALPVLLDRLAGPAANRLTTGTTRVQAARTA